MSRNNIYDIIKKYCGIILLTISLIVALFSFDEYGIAWDEDTQRATGLITAEYVNGDSERLFTWKDRDYGSGFELTLIVIERVLNLEDPRSIYLMRHLVTHLFFLTACYFLLLLVQNLYKNKLLASIAFLLLVLHPRIYAHSFFNSKDIPFMSMFIISMYFTVKAFSKYTLVSFLKLAICAGLLINIRIMGVILPTCVSLAILLDILFNSRKKYSYIILPIFISTTLLTLYITWPFLWKSPINNFLFAFENMSKFRWDNLVLFQGKLTSTREMSWTYLPIWFIITTPITYTVLGLIGIIGLIVKIIRKPLSHFNNSIDRHNALFLVYFAAPIAAVIILQSVLYDSWRQLFFIYPAFILLIIFGVFQLGKINAIFRKISIILLFLTFTVTSIQMISMFPFQHVSFNNYFAFSSPEYLRLNYELDYWGTSYKQSLEHLLVIDKSPTIFVNFSNRVGPKNLNILPINDRLRIKIVPLDQATYFITNYRWHPQNYNEYLSQEIYSIKVKNSTINSIFKLK